MANDSSGSAHQTDANQREEGKGANALEWGITIIGVLIVLSTMGFIVYEMTSALREDPRLRLTLGTPVADSTLVLVPIEVKNIGGDVASDAVVELCAGPGTCAQISFLYIPRQATRKGTLGFTAPLTGPLEGRIVSYRTP